MSFCSSVQFQTLPRISGNWCGSCDREGRYIETSLVQYVPDRVVVFPSLYLMVQRSCIYFLTLSLFRTSWPLLLDQMRLPNGQKCFSLTLLLYTFVHWRTTYRFNNTWKPTISYQWLWSRITIHKHRLC